MGLGAVLVDRARRWVLAPTGRKVDGETVGERIPGPWFPCRLELPRGTEGRGPGGGPRRSVRAPTIFYRPLDPTGAPVGVISTDWVEVESPELGTGFYDVQGDPEPWRKKRTVIAWQATLQRVDEHPFSVAPDGP